MIKLLLLSIVIATLAIPYLAARDRDERRGLRLALIGVAVFNALYVVAITTIVRSPF